MTTDTSGFRSLVEQIQMRDRDKDPRERDPRDKDIRERDVRERDLRDKPRDEPREKMRDTREPARPRRPRGGGASGDPLATPTASVNDRLLMRRWL